MAAQQEIPPAKMTVPQLKEQLRTFNMFTSGKKADLLHRLETALAAAATTGHASDAEASDAQRASGTAVNFTQCKRACSGGTSLVRMVQPCTAEHEEVGVCNNWHGKSHHTYMYVFNLECVE